MHLTRLSGPVDAPYLDDLFAFCLDCFLVAADEREYFLFRHADRSRIEFPPHVGDDLRMMPFFAAGTHALFHEVDERLGNDLFPFRWEPFEFSPDGIVAYHGRTVF